MNEETTILSGFSNAEKGAYLGAIASLATADRLASEEELEFLEALIESADVNAEQAALIRHAATTETADEDLKKFLDVLKTSELRFSLVSDVIAFAQSDENYTDAEKDKVKEIAQYLGVNNEQFTVLDQFTQKAVQQAPATEADAAQNNSPSGFLDSLGFGDKLKNAGINTNSLFKGALGLIGPILLAKMLGGGRRRGAGGGLLGGLLGGIGGNILGGRGGGLLGGITRRGGQSGFSKVGGLLGRILGA